MILIVKYHEYSNIWSAYEHNYQQKVVFGDTKAEAIGKLILSENLIDVFDEDSESYQKLQERYRD